jgi:hypothetical protein
VLVAVHIGMFVVEIPNLTQHVPVTSPDIAEKIVIRGIDGCHSKFLYLKEKQDLSRDSQDNVFFLFSQAISLSFAFSITSCITYGIVSRD